jgi:hypothetical protein
MGTLRESARVIILAVMAKSQAVPGIKLASMLTQAIPGEHFTVLFHVIMF